MNKITALDLEPSQSNGNMENIKIIGLGKHGVRVATRMYRKWFTDVSFIVCDLDDTILKH